MTRIDFEAWLKSLPPEEQLRRKRNLMSITPFQARAVRIQMGLMPQVEAIIAQADPIAKAAWEFATVFERSSPTLNSLAGALGLTDEQLDAMFEAGAKIKA